MMVLLFPAVLTGCYAYRVFPENYRELALPSAKQTVYIINPELKKEMGILAASGIYTISNDSTNSIKIKLCPLKHDLACGQPVMGTLITLGQIPSYLPDKYEFKYEEQQDGKTTSFQYELKVAERVWFWDMFTFQKNFKKFAGKALAGNYYENKIVANRIP